VNIEPVAPAFKAHTNSLSNEQRAASLSNADRCSLSRLAVEDLARSGISPSEAERAGMFSVEDASTICRDFKPWPSLVIPYFDLDGGLMTYERGGERLPFCRVRYLKVPKQPGSFSKAKVLRYAQPAPPSSVRSRRR
jgi:hypothetical protein